MTVSEAVTELSSIAREFHPANSSLIGLVMSLPSLVVALGAVLAGYLVDRLGDRPVLLAGAFTAVIGDICVILAPSFQILLGGRLLTGVGYVLSAVGAITILMRITTGKQRTMALALWSTTVPVSFILPFLSAGLAASLGSWRASACPNRTVVRFSRRGLRVWAQSCELPGHTCSACLSPQMRSF